MKFKVLSRNEIEDLEPIEDHIVISVRDPNSKRALLPVNTNRLADLFLEFSDINNQQKLYLSKLPESDVRNRIIYFNEFHAKKILDFFNQWKGKVDLILVNCEVGICRSSAIAAALFKILGNDDSIFFKRYLPNSLVYKTILEEHYK